MTIACLELKVKVKVRGQRGRSDLDPFHEVERVTSNPRGLKVVTTWSHVKDRSVSHHNVRVKLKSYTLSIMAVASSTVCRVYSSLW